MHRRKVRVRRGEPKRFRRPEVGDLTLVIEVVRFGDDGQRMTVYQAEPGSADEAALGKLAAR
ncbi:hypothetical protein OHB36_34430 [Streptomyces sp. NBC_00320]|uniref:MmyB family transcriptional regulator n=1 Tax=Streptomyces sp. NBC_00320 TaxID=2975711 RepID=UPI0022537312|nr:hypothetical protein [Streptomyces sp. NBC_00320]MCX5151790.1 hypothetical protein [Streptomyces sp. NBC_00320]